MSLKEEYIKLLKDNNVDVDKLKFRYIKDGYYGEEIWTHPKGASGNNSGLVVTRDTFETLKKDGKNYSIASFIYGNDLPTTFAKGGKTDDWLFVGSYPTGTTYSDKTKSKYGDYKQIAYVFDNMQQDWEGAKYSNYRLAIYSNDKKYQPLIKELEKEYGKGVKNYAKGGATDAEYWKDNKSDFAGWVEIDESDVDDKYIDNHFAKGGSVGDLNPKSFTINELNSIPDVSVSWLERGMPFQSASEKKTLYGVNKRGVAYLGAWGSKKFTISDYAEVEASKGSESLSLTITCYLADSDSEQPYNIRVYTKDNIKGLKEFMHKIVKVMQKGGSLDKYTYSLRVVEGQVEPLGFNDVQDYLDSIIEEGELGSAFYDERGGVIYTNSKELYDLMENDNVGYAKGGEILDIGDLVAIEGEYDENGEQVRKKIHSYADEWKFIDYQEGKPNSGVMFWVGDENNGLYYTPDRLEKVGDDFWYSKGGSMAEGGIVRNADENNLLRVSIGKSIKEFVRKDRDTLNKIHNRLESSKFDYAKGGKTDVRITKEMIEKDIQQLQMDRTNALTDLERFRIDKKIREYKEFYKVYIYGQSLAKGGSMAEGGNIDYFEQHELLEKEYPKIYEAVFEEEELTDYKDTERLLNKLNSMGWTFDYGLDNSPYDLRPFAPKINTPNYHAKGGDIKEGDIVVRIVDLSGRDEEGAKVGDIRNITEIDIEDEYLIADIGGYYSVGEVEFIKGEEIYNTAIGRFKKGGELDDKLFELVINNGGSAEDLSYELNNDRMVGEPDFEWEHYGDEVYTYCQNNDFELLNRYAVGLAKKEGFNVKVSKFAKGGYTDSNEEEWG